jgi:transposase-like protein
MKVISHPPRRELRLLVQCLELYYRQGRSQKDIAKALGVSAATVLAPAQARLRRGLRARGARPARTEALETALARLRPARGGGDRGRRPRRLKAELGTAAAAHFEKIARNGMQIGLSCGFTLYQTIRALRERRFRDSRSIPCSGESTLKLVDLFSQHAGRHDGGQVPPHVQAYALPVQHCCRCARSSASGAACCAIPRSARSSRPPRAWTSR